MAFQINHPASAAMLAALALVAAPDDSRAQCTNGRQGQKNVLLQQRGLQPQNALLQQLQQLQQLSLLQSALQRQTQQNSLLIALYTKQQNALTTPALATTVALDSQQFQIAVQTAMQQTQLALSLLRQQYAMDAQNVLQNSLQSQLSLLTSISQGSSGQTSN
ncbi:MAG TPA: hypothetical protein VNX28_07830 [Gemmataceae bacterium]|jgi:hypothetical protein|nr:hypothetical protein [Gemmataceae bacterium]